MTGEAPRYVEEPQPAFDVPGRKADFYSPRLALVSLDVAEAGGLDDGQRDRLGGSTFSYGS